MIKFKYEVECTPDIRPVCLASDLPDEGEKCRVAGFGDTTGNDNYSSILNEGILSIENHSYCNQVSFQALKPIRSETWPMIATIIIVCFTECSTQPTKMTLKCNLFHVKSHQLILG